MKGKIAFVLGAAVGYVLGTRAGRERYEQIKQGAEKVWHTEPVQRGVTLVRDVLDDKADDVKAFVRRASSDVFANLAKQTSDAKPNSEGQTRSSAATPATKSTTKSKANSAKQSTSAKRKTANSEKSADKPKEES